jgi:hypothetical protein
MLNVEKQELDSRITQLKSLTATQRFLDLPEKEKSLIWKQILRMAQYSSILGERLKL